MSGSDDDRASLNTTGLNDLCHARPGGPRPPKIVSRTV